MLFSILQGKVTLISGIGQYMIELLSFFLILFQYKNMKENHSLIR